MNEVNGNLNSDLLSKSLFLQEQLSTSSQVWGQCYQSHYAEGLRDVVSFVVILYMVSVCDLIRHECSSKDNLLSSSFPFISAYLLLQSS